MSAPEVAELRWESGGFSSGAQARERKVWDRPAPRRVVVEKRPKLSSKDLRIPTGRLRYSSPPERDFNQT